MFKGDPSCEGALSWSFFFLVTLLSVNMVQEYEIKLADDSIVSAGRETDEGGDSRHFFELQAFCQPVPAWRWIARRVETEKWGPA